MAVLSVGNLGCRSTEPSVSPQVAAADSAPPTSEVALHVNRLLSSLQWPNKPSDIEFSTAKTSIPPAHHWVLAEIRKARSTTPREVADVAPLHKIAEKWRLAWPNEPGIQVQMEHFAWMLHGRSPESAWKAELLARGEALLKRFPSHPKVLTHLAVLLPEKNELRALELLAKCAVMKPPDRYCLEQWRLMGSGFTTRRCQGGKVHPGLAARLSGQVVFEAKDVVDAYLLGTDKQPAVDIVLGPEAGRRLADFTARNLGEQLTVTGAPGTTLFDGEIQERVHSGRFTVRAKPGVSGTALLAQICTIVESPKWPTHLPPQPQSPGL